VPVDLEQTAEEEWAAQKAGWAAQACVTAAFWRYGLALDEHPEVAFAHVGGRPLTLTMRCPLAVACVAELDLLPPPPGLAIRRQRAGAPPEEAGGEAAAEGEDAAAVEPGVVPTATSTLRLTNEEEVRLERLRTMLLVYLFVLSSIRWF
jgi:hypothetical protein